MKSTNRRKSTESYKKSHYKTKNDAYRNFAHKQDRNKAQSFLLSDIETKADDALAEAQFSKAYELLNRLHGNRRRRAALKIASLPFYELEYDLKIGLPVSPRLEEDIECVHADIIEVIREGRLEYADESQGHGFQKESKNMSHIRGMVNEAIVAALTARCFNENGQVFFLPSQHLDDISLKKGISSYGIDGRFVSTDEQVPGSQSVQIKSRRYSHDQQQYLSSIQMIYVNDLPAGNRPFSAPNHLSQLLVDDLDATIDQAGQLKIDAASQALSRLIMR